MIHLRIKTEQEMIDTLGSGWRDSIREGWHPLMDKLFGVPLLNSPQEGEFSIKDPIDKRWTITKQMCVPISEEEASKQGTLYFEALEKRKVIERFKGSITVNKINESRYKIRYKPTTGYGFSIEIYEGPTGNCQLCSIAYFNNVLDLIKEEEIKDFMTAVYERLIGTVGKRLFLIDVHNAYHYRKKVEHLCISGLTPYTSTNGSKMMTGILKV